MEWGMTQEMVNIGKQFKDMPEEQGGPFETEAEDRRKFLEAAHSRAGCAGGPRNYGDVRAALHEMVTTEPKLAWAYDMWVVASAVAHQLVADRIFGEVAVGQSDVVQIPLAERAARLDHLLLAYGLASQRFFPVVKPGQQPEGFLVALQGLRSSDTLARGLQGEADA